MQCQHDEEHLDTFLESAKWALWFALIVNLVMFVVEIASSFTAQSESLKADAMDFFSDAVSYALTLFVLRSAIAVRDRMARLKAYMMLGLGLWVLGSAIYKIFFNVVPEPVTMGWVGFFGLVSNLSVALVLFKFRGRDMNMRSVWLCSRNDAVGNLAVMLAALGVWGTSTRWPDLAVASIIALLNIAGSLDVFRGLKTPHTHTGD